MWNKIKSKVQKAKYLFVAPVEMPNPTLQVSIFQQNIGSIPQLQFLLPRNQVNQNNSVDTSYNAETGHGQIFVPETKDFYMGGGSDAF